MASSHLKRLVLVGYGRFAPKHLEVFRAVGVEIVAACNRSEAGRAKATLEGKIPRTYSSIPEMLAQERPDGVLCTASVDGVYSAACEILPSGIPTLLEKPPGTTLAEFEELCSLARRHSAPVMVAFNRRHYSVVRKAIEDLGGLENVTGVFIDWTEDPKYLLATGRTRHQVERMIFGNSIHGLDLLTWFGGPILDPQVSVRNLGGAFRWMMALQGVSERGVLSSFRSTWDAPGRWRVEVTGPDRRYFFSPLESCKVSERGVNEDRTLEPDEIDRRFKAGLYVQAQRFLEMMASGAVPADVSLESARPSMVLAEPLTDALLARSHG